VELPYKNLCNDERFRLFASGKENKQWDKYYRLKMAPEEILVIVDRIIKCAVVDKVPKALELIGEILIERVVVMIPE